MSLNNEDEDGLLKRFLSGERGAQREFLNKYGGLVRYIVRSIRVKSDAITEEDLFMGALEHIFENNCEAIRAYQHRSSFSWYLGMVCRRYALSVAMKENRRTENADDAEVEELQGDFFEEEQPDKERLELFSEALKKLKGKDRIFAQMAFLDQRSTDEIMEFFHWSSSTVYSQKNKIINKLKKLVNKMVFEKSSHAIEA